MMARIQLVSSFLLLIMAGPAYGQVPTTPTYSTDWADDTTGNNEFVSPSDGNSYWHIDSPPGDAGAGADEYWDNIYERPTVQGFQLVSHPAGGTRYAADRFYPELDIVAGKIGRDSRFIYVQIALFGTDQNGDLSQEYTIELDYDNDLRGDFLFTTHNPGANNATGLFTQNAVYGFEDTNEDVGGYDPALSQSAGDGTDPGLMNGYDLAIFGYANPYFWVRIDPVHDSVIEFAVDYLALGTYLGQTLDPDSVLRCGGADKGIQDNWKYYFHDKYTIDEAGTPYDDAYGPPHNICEYDNGGIPPITCVCDHQADFDADGFTTALDLAAEIDALFASGTDPQDPYCPTTRGDFDCDGFSTALDLSALIDHLFAGGPPPCDPCSP